ncbi:MAG: 4Fe-4S binding protein [Eubacterium sp.]|jgi:NAD-dependent dihydropyrimidine dehydrogenase PreA subunit|nr:4Fe-4S binding protein [Eubacterium sp.]
MRYVQIVFSPAGGTQRVADAVTEVWGNDIDRVDLSDAGTDFSKTVFEEEDVVLAAVPSYGGRVPELAVKRLEQIHGCRARCVIVCVYGNRAYEDTLVELQDIAEKCGFRVMAAIAAVAEHSIMHQYAAGRPDAQDIMELQDFSKKILEKLKNNNAVSDTFAIPGNRPYKKAGGAGLVPKAGKQCVGCGLCAKDCPAQAISKDRITTADAEKCISCMRCVVRCPESARKVSSALVSVAALAIKKACSVKKRNELFL